MLTVFRGVAIEPGERTSLLSSDPVVRQEQVLAVYMSVFEGTPLPEVYELEEIAIGDGKGGTLKNKINDDLEAQEDQQKQQREPWCSTDCKVLSSVICVLVSAPLLYASYFAIFG